MDTKAVNWAFAIQSSIQQEVEKRFPAEARQWPIIQAFDAEAYLWRDRHIIVVLRDKLSGIPTMGAANQLDDVDAPNEAPTPSNLPDWLGFCEQRFSVRPQDAVMILPLLRNAPDKPEEQWDLFTESERELWGRQLNYALMKQYYHVKGLSMAGGFVIPPGYQFLAEQCAAFLSDHPDYQRNTFIMTRLQPGNQLLERLDRELRQVLREHGLDPVRADDKMYMPDRNLWNNVCVYLICCSRGVAILEDRIANEFNPNVALEYGFMRALNKPSLLLADTGFRNLRADIIGTLRETFDITDISGTIRQPVERWLRELGISAN